MKFLFENNKGKVLESPIDKMRVLAPEFHSTMPCLLSYSQSTMPVYKIFPEGLKPEKQKKI
ncbi:MAG: hypothetical protein Q8891_14765 [Bacteroidota bacterium]|nr:hypothetical protein [Bacteroidota bacterium]